MTTIKSLMQTRKVATIREEDDLALASQMMLWSGIRHLPVLRGSRVVGVISQRDVLGRIADGGAAGLRERVGLAMSRPVTVVRPGTEVGRAIRTMLAAGIGCLPVVERGRLVGILTRSDLLSHGVAGAVETSPPVAPAVARLMVPKPVTAAADDLVLDAAARMANRGVRHLPVIDGDGRVVGMFSERDLRAAIGNPMRAVDTKATATRARSLRVQDVMSRPAITVSADTPMPHVAALFIDRGVGAIPVVDEDDRLVGIVSYVDLLRTLSEPRRPIGATTGRVPRVAQPSP